jgi:hypothetical protein
MADLVQRHSSKVLGTISCFDRVVITGTLPAICHSRSIGQHLASLGVRLFDYPRWAEPFKAELRANAEGIAKAAGLEIEYIRKKNFRKEERIKAVVAERGGHPGMVHIFSVMEGCPSFNAWYNKKTGMTSLISRDAKCLHYYFYFIDELLGLCYLRVPTWAPFRLQFYFNGHNWLAHRLRDEGINFELHDNAFVQLSDFARAQLLAASFDISQLHEILDMAAQKLCPVGARFPSGYHWSLMQVEYSTDIIWRSQADLQPVYDVLVRTAIHAVKAEQVATFLGRKLQSNSSEEIGNDFHTRIEGTRIRHHMGPVALKMYDKMGRVLRIETTANNVTFFKHHRMVEQRDGKAVWKNAPLRKTIYSLPMLAELMGAANRRYLDFLSSLEDPSAGFKHLDKLGRTAYANDRSYRGFNLFDQKDLKLFEIIARGEFLISGFQNRNLRDLLPDYSSGRISRLIKCLCIHGLLKKVRNTYKYYLTKLGRNVVLAALKVRRFIVVPALAELAA